MGHYEDFLNKQLKEKEEDRLRYEQTVHQLRTEERFVNFFKSYNPASVEPFIESYAKQKVMWHRYSGNFGQHAAQQLQRNRQVVVDLLENIILKKLFNLKCRWAAGEMDIEGVEVSYDFYRWKELPSLLQAAGPITAEEFYCYLDFFKAGSPERLDEYGDPQGSAYHALHQYHASRSCLVEDAADTIPDWFHLYDRHFQTAHLMHLPTTRIDMEQDHLDEWQTLIHAETLSPDIRKYIRPMNRQIRERLATDPAFKKEWKEEGQRLYDEQHGGKPKYESFSVYNREIMEEVVKAIETRDVQRMYFDDRKWYDLTNRDEDLSTPVYYLQDVKEYVAVSPNEDYREAIREAYEQHLHSTNCEALVMLFEEYETCQRNGHPFNWDSTRTEYGRGELRNRILAVRERKGLPQNFDFLKKNNLP